MIATCGVKWAKPSHERNQMAVQTPKDPDGWEPSPELEFPSVDQLVGVYGNDRCPLLEV